MLGLGLSLTWGLLRVINLANFALAFLGAYLTYQLATTLGLDPILTLVLIAPGFFAVGIALGQALHDNPTPGGQQTLLHTTPPLTRTTTP